MTPSREQNSLPDPIDSLEINSQYSSDEISPGTDNYKKMIQDRSLKSCLKKMVDVTKELLEFENENDQDLYQNDQGNEQNELNEPNKPNAMPFQTTVQQNIKNIQPTIDIDIFDWTDIYENRIPEEQPRIDVSELKGILDQHILFFFEHIYQPNISCFSVAKWFEEVIVREVFLDVRYMEAYFFGVVWLGLFEFLLFFHPILL